MNITLMTIKLASNGQIRIISDQITIISPSSYHYIPIIITMVFAVPLEPVSSRPRGAFNGEKVMCGMGPRQGRWIKCLGG